MRRRAKIICTLGPSSSSEEMIEALIKAGMDVARLNFSHGDHNFYRMVINRIRHVSAKLKRPIAILQDLQGPKIRTGQMDSGQILLETGHETVITTTNVLGTPKKFSTDFLSIVDDVQVGDRIVLSDGKIVLRCLDKTLEGLRCGIEEGGVLKNNQGINLPNSGTSAPSLSAKDKRDLHFGAEAQVDAVALSFARTAEDVRGLREELARSKVKPLIIAKLEKQQAMENLASILEVADGVMVARGDLGVEIPPETVPLLQKQIIEEAISHGKSVTVATEMLESMTTQIRPTRAEASDVANAILDGADLLMLSAETASGKFPVQAVQIMDRIIRHVEESPRANYWLSERIISFNAAQDIQNALALSAARTCEALNANALVMFTNSGQTARLVSAYRPRKPIIAFVPNVSVQRALAFSWGVSALVLEAPSRTSTLIQKMNDHLLRLGDFVPGERVVVLTKIPLDSTQRTNTIHIHTLKRTAPVES